VCFLASGPVDPVRADTDQGDDEQDAAPEGVLRLWPSLTWCPVTSMCLLPTRGTLVSLITHPCATASQLITWENFLEDGNLLWEICLTERPGENRSVQC